VKRGVIIGIGAGVIGIIVLTVLVISLRSNNEDYFSVYFFNPSAMILVSETFSIPDGDDPVMQSVEYMRSRHWAGGHESTWPFDQAPEAEDLIRNVRFNDSALLVFFSSVFFDVPALERSLFKTAFIYTMESLYPEMEIKVLVADDYELAYEVLMLSLPVDDEEEYPYVLIYNSEHPGIYNNPDISPRVIQDRTFSNLYLVDASGTGLIVREYEAIDVSLQREAIAGHAFELLITLPSQEGAMSVIPAETDIIIETSGVHMTIDLSNDFYNRFEGDKHIARLMIYSIVNTMAAELNTPNLRVFFWIDSQQVENFHGVEDFHLEFVRDHSLLLSDDHGYEDEAVEYGFTESRGLQ